jgi:hypothetical protein
MKHKNLISVASNAGSLAFLGETGENGDQPGLTMSLHKKGALSFIGIVCLILCFLVGLAAIFLLLFSLV